MSKFKVWVEIEQVDEQGNHEAEWSAMLEGGAVAFVESLDEAIEFGEKLQALSITISPGSDGE